VILVSRVNFLHLTAGSVILQMYNFWQYC